MKGQLKIITAMLLFGSIGIFVKNITLASNELAFLRAVIGSLFLIAAGLVIKQKPSWKAIKDNILVLLLSGTAVGFNWILLFQGYKYTTIANATLSYYFAPVFVVIMSPIILKEKFTKIKLICITVSMIGLSLILNLNNGSIGSSQEHLKGIAFGLSAAVLYAAVMLLNKFIKNLSGFETTLIQLLMAALVLLPTLFYQSSFSLNMISANQWVFILIVGLIHTGVGYFLYFTSFKELDGQSIAIISYIDPISAVIFAAVFLQERMTPLQIVGGILILASTFFSQRTGVKIANG